MRRSKPLRTGFIIADDEAHDLLRLDNADDHRVVRPYLTGDDIANDPRPQPRRWVIGFAYLQLETAMK